MTGHRWHVTGHRWKVIYDTWQNYQKHFWLNISRDSVSSVCFFWRYIAAITTNCIITMTVSSEELCWTHILPNVQILRLLYLLFVAATKQVISDTGKREEAGHAWDGAGYQASYQALNSYQYQSLSSPQWGASISSMVQLVRYLTITHLLTPCSWDINRTFSLPYFVKITNCQTPDFPILSSPAEQITNLVYSYIWDTVCFLPLFIIF